MQHKLIMSLWVLVLGLSSLSAHAAEDKHMTGIGVIMGDTTGFTLKSYINKYMAFDVAAGLASGYRSFPGIATQADLMWTDEMVRVPEGALLFYFGGGAFWAMNTTSNVETGIRGLTGAEYFFHKSKFAVFAELAPTVTVTYNPGVNLHFAIGGRYYF